MHCAKHKRTLVSSVTTACYLVSLCLPFFLNSQRHCHWHALCMYTFPPSSMALTASTSLSSHNFMLLIASQPSCLAACAIQAYWARGRQFGSTQLPTDQCYSSHCHSLRDFLLTRRACWDGGWDCVSRHNLLNLVLLAMQQSHGNTTMHTAELLHHTLTQWVLYLGWDKWKISSVMAKCCVLLSVFSTGSHAWVLAVKWSDELIEHTTDWIEWSIPHWGQAGRS